MRHKAAQTVRSLFVWGAAVMVLGGCATREDMQTTSREVNETRKLAADLRADLASVKEGDLSGLQKQLDRERRDIEGLNRRLDDQSAQVSTMLGSLDQKLTGKLHEQTDKIKAQGKALEEQVARVEARDSAGNARVQEVLTAVGKKMDERLEGQDQRFQARAEALEGHIKKVETESRTAAGGLAAADKSRSETLKTVGSKLSAQADQQALALAKLEDSMKQMDLQTRTLSAQVSQFQGTLSEFSKAFRALNEKSSEVDRRTSEVTGKTGEKLGTLMAQQAEQASRQAEQASRMAALSKTVEAAVVTVNETTRAVGELKQAVGESVGKLEARVDSQGEAVRQVAQRLAGTPATVNGPAPAPAPAEPEPVRQAAVVPKAAAEPQAPSKEAYEQAYKDYTKGRYDVALTSFRNFLHQYPNSPLVPNAYFWSGECYFKTGDYARGIEAYEQVVKNYPKSAKASSALYRKALALLKLKDKGAAKATLREVIANYPKSDDSERARAMLSSLQ